MKPTKCWESLYYACNLVCVRNSAHLYMFFVPLWTPEFDPNGEKDLKQWYNFYPLVTGWMLRRFRCLHNVL